MQLKAGWGNPNSDFSKLSIKELSLWVPNLKDRLNDLGISALGNDDISLSFLCENTGLKPKDVLNHLSIHTKESDKHSHGVTSLTIKAGKLKNGNKETFKELELTAGDVISLVGPTGSGKSQFLSDIESLTQGDSASGRSILLNNKKPNDNLYWSPSLRPIAQISQSMNFIIDTSVGEFIDLHSNCRLGKSSEDIKERVINAACTLCGEPFNSENQLALLSGGQSRALMIADAVLISRAQIVLVDEIENAGLDKIKAVNFLLSESNISIIATHDPLIALSTKKRIIFKNGGVYKIINKSQQESKMYKKLLELNQINTDIRETLRSGELLLDGF